MREKSNENQEKKEINWKSREKTNENQKKKYNKAVSLSF